MAHYAAYARYVFDAEELVADCVASLSRDDTLALLAALDVPFPVDPNDKPHIAKLIVQHNKQRIAAVQLDPKLLEKVRQATSVTTISDKYFTKLTDDERLGICSEVGVDLILDEKKRMAERIRDKLHPDLAVKDWPTTKSSIITRIKQTQSATSIRKLLNNRSELELAEVCHELGVSYNPKESKQKLAMRIAHREALTPLQEININHTNIPMAIPVPSSPDHIKVQIYDLNRDIRMKQQLVLTLEQQLDSLVHHTRHQVQQH